MTSIMPPGARSPWCSAIVPWVLREWRLTDGQGRTTQVRLTNLEPTSGLDDALFVVPGAAPGARQCGIVFLNCDIIVTIKLF